MTMVIGLKINIKIKKKSLEFNWSEDSQKLLFLKEEMTKNNLFSQVKPLKYPLKNETIINCLIMIFDLILSIIFPLITSSPINLLYLKLPLTIEHLNS